MSEKDRTQSGSEADPQVEAEAARERQRRWYDWLPLWVLMPFGLAPDQAAGHSPHNLDGYGGPLDQPGGHHGDFGGGGGFDGGGGGF